MGMMGNTEHALHGVDASDGSKKQDDPLFSQSFPKNIEITRPPTETSEVPLDDTSQSTFHIYHKKELHKCISPVVDLSKERIWGPTIAEQKAKKQAKRYLGGRLPMNDENAFFLHTPYLAFHDPPRVLYMGSTKHAKPVVLIHSSWFWREYKLQLGDRIAENGVLDPRGVVSWQHNGGNKSDLKCDDTLLKGYKVRTWRLWGETGKKYVHKVKTNRKVGVEPDPDIINDAHVKSNTAKADEVVYLRWSNPLSSQTRRYHFKYRGIDFFWKGTGTVKEGRMCGFLLRYNHLKLVAKLPAPGVWNVDDLLEVCLGKYTSSIASKKSGILEFYDAAILRLVEQHMPEMLKRDPIEELERQEAVSRGWRMAEDTDEDKMLRIKRRSFYHVIVATAVCMLTGEKEKREVATAIVCAAAEGGAGAGS